MKKLALGLLVAAVCVPWARAGDIGAFGSYWDPNKGDNLWGAGVSYLAEYIPLEIRATYYDSIDTEPGGKLDVLPIDAGLAVNLTRAKALDLYVGGGASYFFLDSDEKDLDNKLGWYVMARLEVPIEGSYSIFGEVMHRDVDVGRINTDLSGTVINVGIVFR